ncbi:hypothetical protein AX16_000190 [Volvariella volvacea WC 439]|nr:hypothetical protein AX16_000190 [Volvariella volvacea WC 439]
MGISSMMKPVKLLRGPWKKKDKKANSGEATETYPRLYLSAPQTPISSLLTMSPGQMSYEGKSSSDSSPVHLPRQLPTIKRRQRADSSLTACLPVSSPPTQCTFGGQRQLSSPKSPKSLFRTQSLRQSSTTHCLSCPRRPPRPPSPHLFKPPPPEWDITHTSIGLKVLSSDSTSTLHSLQPVPVALDEEPGAYSEEDSESESEEGPRTPRVSGFLEGRNLRDSDSLSQRTLTYHAYGDDILFATPGPRKSHRTSSSPVMESPTPHTSGRYRSRSGSSPHLPLPATNFEGDSLTGPAFPLSLFPAPPPLNIRKKVPGPLALQRDPSSTSLLPSPSVTSSMTSLDMTPLSTPTSPKLAFSPPRGPLLRSSISRCNGHVLPPPCSPPTSPLPDPPVSPNFPSHNAFQSRHLRVVRSTSNLRREMQAPATHRITSSDPSQRPEKTGPLRTKAASLNPAQVAPFPSLDSSDPDHIATQVHWGYAI